MFSSVYMYMHAFILIELCREQLARHVVSAVHCLLSWCPQHYKSYLAFASSLRNSHDQVEVYLRRVAVSTRQLHASNPLLEETVGGESADRWMSNVSSARNQ